MLNNLSFNLIEQFFMDCTYSTVPPSINKFKLMILSGYDINNNKTLLCAFILLMNERKNTFDEIFTILKTKYNFNPNNIMCDFKLSQIKSIQSIFPRCKIHGYFFHYIQAIWKHFMKYGLPSNKNYSSNVKLLFNLQLLCFINLDKIDSFYNCITKKFKDNKYKSFFNYFKRTWLGTSIPKILWNYSNLLQKIIILIDFLLQIIFRKI